VRVGGHIELSNDYPKSGKFRNENDVIYEVDAFVNVVLSEVYKQLPYEELVRTIEYLTQ
jgi:hypothetical protein